MPSICHEVNPTVIKEAFAARLPVIASDQGSTNEMIVEGVNGLSFRAGDAGDLKAKMLVMVNEADVWTRVQDAIPKLKTVEQEGLERKSIYEACMREKVAVN